MLRALLVLLLAANVVFFAWVQGWLAPTWPPPRAGEREPQRLAAQVHPDRIRVLTPQAASAALSAAREATLTCLEAGPLDAAALAAAEAALGAAGLPAGGWERQDTVPPSPRRWLRVPRADPAQQAALQALGWRGCEAR